MAVYVAGSAPLTASFPDTGNTVYVDPPDSRPVEEHQARLGALGQMILRVRRQCTDQEGQSASFNEFKKMQIPSDAARVFWLVFETVRESDFRENNSIAGYPVAPSEDIQDNALVRTCDLEWSYDGGPTRMMPLSSVPTIRITERAWREAQRRLSTQEKALPHVSFALDAAYFLESDPIRAIIMACAAWETALRYYLANVASVRDPAYLVASHGGNIPRLREFMKAAKGGDLFYDNYGKGNDALWNVQRDYINLLPTWRNKLLHEGKDSIPPGSAIDTVLALLNAIEWLFA